MELLIRLEREQPPVGVLVPLPDSDRPPSGFPFVGWLGLLRVLAEAMGEPADSTES